MKSIWMVSAEVRWTGEASRSCLGGSHRRGTDLGRGPWFYIQSDRRLHGNPNRGSKPYRRRVVGRRLARHGDDRRTSTVRARNADEGVFDAPFSAYEYEIEFWIKASETHSVCHCALGPDQLISFESTLVATRREPLWLETYIDYWDELEEPREPFLEVDREDRWYGSDEEEGTSGAGDTGTTAGGAG